MRVLTRIEPQEHHFIALTDKRQLSWLSRRTQDHDMLKELVELAYQAGQQGEPRTFETFKAGDTIK